MPAKPLATDFDADGIRVNCVVPSIVDTPMSRADLWRIGKGFEEALPDAPARGDRGGGYLASDLARGVNGTTHALDFGALARPAFPRDGGAVPVPCAGRAASSSRRDGTSGRVPRHNGRAPRRR